jgi:hypothetical protein
MDRRGFLGGAAVSACVVALPAHGAGRRAESGGFSFVADPAVVSAVVGASHGDAPKVAELVATYPELANAALDWGFGDWETALGAASHTGRREIADLLLRHGARPDQFALAMLGHVDGLRAMVAARPGLQRERGPHDISLLAHAQAGGEEAKLCLEYLESLGDAGLELPSAPLADADRDAMLGRYALEGGGEVTIELRPRGLFIGDGVGPVRGLRHVGGLVFHPAGARSVSIVASPGEPATVTARGPMGDLWRAARAGG